MTINLLVIRTEQLDKLAEFYSQLGISFEKHKHGNGPLHYASELDDLVFEIYPVSKNSHVDSSLRLGFSVENLDDLILNLKKYGTEIIKMPNQNEWGYSALIKDLDNRKVELQQINYR